MASRRPPRGDAFRRLPIERQRRWVELISEDAERPVHVAEALGISYGECARFYSDMKRGHLIGQFKRERIALGL